jgi:hypothetical protein
VEWVSEQASGDGSEVGEKVAGRRRGVAFSPEVDALIEEIDGLGAGATQRLWRYLYRNRRGTPVEVIERELRAMREELRQAREE